MSATRSRKSLVRVPTVLFGTSSSRVKLSGCCGKLIHGSAATNAQNGEGVAIKKVTNVFSKKILAKRALRELKLLQHFRGTFGDAACPNQVSL
jgi:hypothetical protein